MDPLVSSAIAQTQAQTQALTQSTIAVSMLKKTVDIMAQQGADMVQLLAQQTGVGQRVDLYA